MVNDVELKTKKICSNCGSGETYLRIRKMERICRQCGHIEPVTIEQKEEEHEN